MTITAGAWCPRLSKAYTSPMSKAPHRSVREVGIRELRDNLSRFLDDVQAGRELIVTDRGRPVARIVGTGESWVDELVAAGIVTLPERQLDLSSFGRVDATGDLMEFVFDQRR
jgi:prevent-host-death family protein